MISRKIPVFLLAAFLFVAPALLFAQTTQPQQRPITSQELVSMLYQLPRRPEKPDEIVDAIRLRGIGFPLTDGMRSLVATKSGNDALLRRTPEEAERRRRNPTDSTTSPA